MNTKVYEKTRYQNIYRHKKNKNYLIMISKPVKSSIASVNGEKIYKLDDALKIRDNPKIKIQKGVEVKYKDGFDDLWKKYIFACKNDLKLAYNTCKKKEKTYNKYLKNKFDKKISKYVKNDFIIYINNLDTTDKQKNEVLKTLKAFLNWCVNEEYLLSNPVVNIKKFKVEKPEMKYWIPNDVQNFFRFINNYIQQSNDLEKETAYRTKIFTLIGFILGDRVGETRALSFGSIKSDKLKISINHSINYNSKDSNFLSTTKTYSSQRDIDTSLKLIQEIQQYRNYLQYELGYSITNNTLIFFNHHNNRPFSDTTLRKNFYKFCDLANVPRIRMYDLRHTYVATMMSEGLELYLISEKLGHTSYSTTVNKYGHLSNQVRQEVARITDKYI